MKLRPKEMTKGSRFYTLETETINLWRIDRTKKALRASTNIEPVSTRNSEEILGWGSKLEKKSNNTAFSPLNFPSLVMRMSLYLLVQGGFLSHGKFIFCSLAAKVRVFLHWLFLFIFLFIFNFIFNFLKFTSKLVSI